MGQACVERRNVSVLFVVDVSRSMAESDGTVTKINAARQFGIDVTNALSSSGITVEGAIATFCGNYDGGRGVCYMTLTYNNLDWTTPSNVVAGFSAPFTICDGTALNHAIVSGAEKLRSRGGTNLKLLVLLTDGIDESACRIFASPSSALAGGDIISRLVFIGPPSEPLREIARLAGPTSQALDASASSLSSLVSNILDATCINHMPVAGVRISDDNLLLGTDGFMINFDGSSSTDRETASSFLIYEWTFRRPDGTSFTRSGRSLNETFNDDQLAHGTNWQVSLRVQDTRGIWSIPFTENFSVTGSPPNITLTSSPASPFDANVSATITANPENDIDGGPLSFVWTVTNSPDGAELPAGPLNTRTFSLSTAEQNITTFSDGTDFRTPWRFQCQATDDEGQTDMENIEIRIRNLKPRIHITGPAEINIHETISLQTDILTDDDGGNLSFRWAIIQSPNSSMVGTPSSFATGPNMSMPTSRVHAGTWRFRLTATDNEGEEVSEDYTVLVDGPPDANISGPVAGVGSIFGFPLTLDGRSSVDPDSRDLCPDYCHTSSDGPVQGISPDIVRYTWYLVDAPTDNPDLASLGRVDEVLEIDGSSSQLVIPVANRLTPGVYTFQLRVEDGEGNENTEDFVVNVVEEESKPVSIIIPPYNIQYVDPISAVLASDITFNGALSFDPDNFLSSTPSLGVTRYTWNITDAPPGCILAPVLGTASTAILFTAGTPIDPLCQGLWKVALTVTDDDAIPKESDIKEAVIIIGNCPANLCVDYPTTSNPQTVQFSSATDVLIYFHLNSVLYTLPASLAGTIARIQIFHQADLTAPFYSFDDPNLFATDLGGRLVFHWNGFGSGNRRPLPGYYHVKITLLNESLGVEIGADMQMNAISIAVAKPLILSTSEKYVNRDTLVAGTDNLAINYKIDGGGIPSEMVWRIFDAGNAEVARGTIPNPPVNGSFNWNGQNSAATVVPTGVYELELETLAGTASMGKSSRQSITVFRMAITVATGSMASIPNTQFLLVNGDDDNNNNNMDATETTNIPGEDDLRQLNVVFEPAAATGNLIYRFSTGSTNVKLWTTDTKGTEITPARTFVLGTDPIPASIFTEGVIDGAATLQFIFTDAAMNGIDTVAQNLKISNVNLAVDVNMNSATDFADDKREMNDSACIVNVNNNNDGGAAGSFDCFDNVINGAVDKTELTKLIIKRNANMPAGWRMVLRVSDKTRIRIFDQMDNGIIGPPMADGGPDADSYDIPAANITAGDLTYRIECVHGGLVTISLVLFEAASTEIARDEIKIALNVNRDTGNVFSHIRDRINLSEDLPNLEGIEANLSGNKPIVSWEPTSPNVFTISYWISIQGFAINHWLQTGSRVIRNSGGVEREEIYFEFVPDYSDFLSMANPLGYQVFTKPATGWSSGDFKVEITNRATGEAKAYLNGMEWRTATDASFIAAVFVNYQIGSESNQTVTRTPGTLAAKAIVSASRFKDIAGWHNTSFNASNILIHKTNGRGVVTRQGVIGAAVSASLENFHFTWLTGQSFEMWDDR